MSLFLSICIDQRRLEPWIDSERCWGSLVPPSTLDVEKISNVFTNLHQSSTITTIPSKNIHQTGPKKFGAPNEFNQPGHGFPVYRRWRSHCPGAAGARPCTGAVALGAAEAGGGLAGA